MARHIVTVLKTKVSGRLISFGAVSLIAVGMSVHALGAVLDLNDEWGRKASTVTFEVFIGSAPNEVTSLGFDVRYDASVLKFKGYEPGNLVSGFDFFDANPVSPGVVRIGGLVVGASKIDQGDSGSLVSLTFEVIGHDDCDVFLSGLKDGIKAWSTNPGRFTGDHEVEETPPEETSPAIPESTAGAGSIETGERQDSAHFGAGGGDVDDSASQGGSSAGDVNLEASLSDLLGMKDPSPSRPAAEDIKPENARIPDHSRRERGLSQSSSMPDKGAIHSKSMGRKDPGESRAKNERLRNNRNPDGHKGGTGVLSDERVGDNPIASQGRAGQTDLSPHSKATGPGEERPLSVWELIAGFMAGCVFWELTERPRRMISEILSS